MFVRYGRDQSPGGPSKIRCGVEATGAVVEIGNRGVSNRGLGGDAESEAKHSHSPVWRHGSQSKSWQEPHLCDANALQQALQAASIRPRASQQASTLAFILRRSSSQKNFRHLAVAFRVAASRVVGSVNSPGLDANAGTCSSLVGTRSVLFKHTAQRYRCRKRAQPYHNQSWIRTHR